MIEITQADRDAANELIAVLFYDEAQEHINAEAIARNFARHRTTSLAAQDGLVEALRKIGALHQPSHLNDAVQIARKALSAMGAKP